MAFNIVDLLKSQLGGQIAGQLGKQFGESETTAKAGVDALVPTILGGLLKQVSSPGGPEKLDKTIKEGGYDGGLLDGLSGMLTGGGAEKLSGKGGDLVSSLFGDKAAMLMPILSKLTGLKLDSVQSMLAMLAPLVMSFLGKQQKAMGLDASGLANMLISQKDSISAALPPGVSDAMGIAGLSTPAPAASHPAPVASRPAPVASAPSSSGSGMLPKALIALAILAAVGYGCYLYIFAGILPSGPAGNSVVAPPPEGASQGSYGGMQPNGQPIQPAEPAESESPATESPDASNSSSALAMPDLSSLSSLGGMPDLQGIFGSVGETFEKITDVESAKAALPELVSANEKLQGLSSGFAAMPEAVRTKISELVTGTLPDLQSTIDKVLAIPGVGEILKPIVDQMMEKVVALKG